MKLETELLILALGPLLSPLVHLIPLWLCLVAGLNGGYQDELVDHRLTEREWADEWKHLDHVRSCRGCGKLCRKHKPSVPPAPVGDFLVDTISRLSWWLVEKQATTSRWMVGRAERSCSTFLAGFLCPWSVESKIGVDEVSGAGELLLQSMARCCHGWLSNQPQLYPHWDLIHPSPGQHQYADALSAVRICTYKMSKPIITVF